MGSFSPSLLATVFPNAPGGCKEAPPAREGISEGRSHIFPLGRRRTHSRNLILFFGQLMHFWGSKAHTVGRKSKPHTLPPSRAGPGGAGRGAGEGTISLRGGAQAAATHPSERASSLARPPAGCLVGAAEVSFLGELDKDSLIGRRDPAVVGRKESSCLIGRSAPAMRQGAAGVAGSA